VTTVALPSWNAEGWLPPIDASNPTASSRAPYRVPLTDLILRFGTSRERCTILDGMLRYRAALHAAGLVTGFQWIDGSFLEHAERLISRPPADIDVVTFFRIAQGDAQADVLNRSPDLFDHGKAKAKFNVDGYLVSLDQAAENLVKHSAYWYSVWSHRREWTWKGFVEVDLAPDDATALAVLKAASCTGATP
jgi:hypothetical protein